MGAMSLYRKGLITPVSTIRIGETIDQATSHLPTSGMKEKARTLMTRARTAAEGSGSNFVLVSFPAGTSTMRLDTFNDRQSLEDAFWKIAEGSGDTPPQYTALFDKTIPEYPKDKAPVRDFGSVLIKLAVRASPDPKPETKSSTPTKSAKVIIKESHSSGTGVWWVLGGLTAGIGLLWYKDKRKKAVT